MTSRVFQATNDGVCSLSGLNFTKGTPVFYLTCKGGDPIPARQIEKSNKAEGYSTGYRLKPTGETREIKGANGYSRYVPIFGWEERVGNRWVKLEVWERLVTVTGALNAGFRVPGGLTNAHLGKREEGMAHRRTSVVTEVVDTAPDLTPKAKPVSTETPIVGMRVIDDSPSRKIEDSGMNPVRPLELD